MKRIILSILLLLTATTILYAKIDYYKITKIEKLAKKIPEKQTKEERERIKKEVNKEIYKLSKEERDYIMPKIKKIEKENNKKIQQQKIEKLNNNFLINKKLFGGKTLGETITF